MDGNGACEWLLIANKASYSEKWKEKERKRDRWGGSSKKKRKEKKEEKNTGIEEYGTIFP